VLRYLPTHLSAPEIAAELSVSTTTVKTHLRNLYAKLGAHRRTEAVDSAAPWACSRPPHTSADSPAFRKLGPSASWQIIRIVRWPLSPTASRLVLTASGLATCAGRSGRSFRYEAHD
jgi:hypothetical protein